MDPCLSDSIIDSIVCCTVSGSVIKILVVFPHATVGNYATVIFCNKSPSINKQQCSLLTTHYLLLTVTHYQLQTIQQPPEYTFPATQPCKPLQAVHPSLDHHNSNPPTKSIHSQYLTI